MWAGSFWQCVSFSCNDGRYLLEAHEDCKNEAGGGENVEKPSCAEEEVRQDWSAGLEKEFNVGVILSQKSPSPSLPDGRCNHHCHYHHHHHDKHRSAPSPSYLMVDVDSACLIAAHCGEVQPASSTSPYLCSPEHHFTFIYVRLGKFNQFQFNLICVFWSNAINVIINFIQFQHQLYPCHHHCVRTRPESRWWSSRLDVPLVPHWTARRTLEGGSS